MKYKSINVRILDYTPNPEQLCAIAAKNCQSRIMPKHVNSPEKLLDVVVGSGHYSVIEHASITYGIEGVSRALSHQLVRHRIAAYSQQSQRHVPPESVIEPPRSVKENARALEIFNKTTKDCTDGYNELINELNIPEEDARYILQNRVTTNIVDTMNFRELVQSLFPQRICERAQTEIRNVSYAMLGGVKLIAPNIFKNAGTNCLIGQCKETEKTPNCHKVRTNIKKLDDIIESYREEFNELTPGEWMNIDYVPMDFEFKTNFQIKKVC
ncbi:MAG: FAD-dependent thymidylate synthase [Candidatus Aenigmarchaeota archaeon]|nr:FAD-dependent thymidylate synthase [Candidatus Aenigmarchaeota archaeon]